MNSVNIIGNLTRDPELRYTPNGVAVADFGIAYNRKYNKDGEKMEEVSFFDCIAWDKLAETMGKFCQKGHKIGLSGELKQERWTTTEGDKRSKIKIVARGVDFLTTKAEAQQNGQQGQQEQQQLPQSFNKEDLRKPLESHSDQPQDYDDIPF